LDALAPTAHSPAEIRRRLRHASVLVASAELPLDRVALSSVLLRARNHLSGTVRKLDQLLAHVDGGIVEPSAADDDQLTEPHVTSTIARTTP
jgi:hypothetical protein